jgi:hypothetical protein
MKQGEVISSRPALCLFFDIFIVRKSSENRRLIDRDIGAICRQQNHYFRAKPWMAIWVFPP